MALTPAPMRVHCLFALALSLLSAAAPGEPRPDVATLQAEREQVEAESRELQGQLQAERERLEELQRRIEEMRRESTALDREIQRVVVEPQHLPEGPGAVSGSPPKPGP